MLTRAKVCYNLHNSPYQLIMKYEEQEIVYRFSSELYKTKFIEKVANHREDINTSLSKRFSVKFNADIVADLRLYSSIEKRGFSISLNGELIECQNNIVLDGLKMTARN